MRKLWRLSRFDKVKMSKHVMKCFIKQKQIFIHEQKINLVSRSICHVYNFSRHTKLGKTNHHIAQWTFKQPPSLPQFFKIYIKSSFQLSAYKKICHSIQMTNDSPQHRLNQQWQASIIFIDQQQASMTSFYRQF